MGGLTYSWRPFGPFDFVLPALRALRPVCRARFRSGPPYLTILDHLEPFWTILDHFDNFDHFHHFGPFWIIWDNFGPFWTILGHFDYFD